MRRDIFPLKLDSSRKQPLYVQISEAIARDVTSGRLRPGDNLPGTRQLAELLGVHRSTVVLAYNELATQSWIETRPGGPSNIAKCLPEIALTRTSRRIDGAVAVRCGYDIGPPAVSSVLSRRLPPGTLALWGGIPDLRLLPVELLTRAYRRAAKRQGCELFGYSEDAYGHISLRGSLAKLLCERRGMSIDSSDLLVTRGSQMALDLIARSLIRPGDTVVVESLCYVNAVAVFRRYGATVVPITVDQDGIDIDALTAFAKRSPVRIVYVTPHHQYPTTVTLGAARRLALLELAKVQHFAIVEDDYDQEFHYDGQPVLPLASRDSGGNVIYVGTLAKILAPGLRLAYVVAPKPLLARMAEERVLVDRQGDLVLECAVAELIEDGDVQRHIRRTKRIYQARRDALCECVKKDLSGILSFSVPPGGLALWALAVAPVDLNAWQSRALKNGVYAQIGKQFSLDGSDVRAVRLGFALHDEKTLKSAVRVLAKSLPI